MAEGEGGTGEVARSYDPANVEIGLARWGEIGTIYRLYRAQGPDSRLLYHPFPFNALRLGSLLVGIRIVQSVAASWVRRAPGLIAVLVVARPRSGGPMMGFGTVTFRRAADRAIVARTGLYVTVPFRRHGLGKGLKQYMLALARSYGVRRAEALIHATNTASIELYRSVGYRIGSSTIRDRRPPYATFLLAETDLT